MTCTIMGIFFDSHLNNGWTLEGLSFLSNTTVVDLIRHKWITFAGLESCSDPILIIKGNKKNENWQIVIYILISSIAADYMVFVWFIRCHTHCTWPCRCGRFPCCRRRRRCTFRARKCRGPTRNWRSRRSSALCKRSQNMSEILACEL